MLLGKTIWNKMEIPNLEFHDGLPSIKSLGCRNKT